MHSCVCGCHGHAVRDGRLSCICVYLALHDRHPCHGNGTTSTQMRHMQLPDHLHLRLPPAQIAEDLREALDLMATMYTMGGALNSLRWLRDLADPTIGLVEYMIFPGMKQLLQPHLQAGDGGRVFLDAPYLPQILQVGELCASARLARSSS